MSLDQAIAHGHEHRRPYYGAARRSETCRPHGGCPRCYRGRMHQARRMLAEADDRMADFFARE